MDEIGSGGTGGKREFKHLFHPDQSHMIQQETSMLAAVMRLRTWGLYLTLDRMWVSNLIRPSKEHETWCSSLRGQQTAFQNNNGGLLGTQLNREIDTPGLLSVYFFCGNLSRPLASVVPRILCSWRTLPSSQHRCHRKFPLTPELSEVPFFWASLQFTALLSL